MHKNKNYLVIDLEMCGVKGSNRKKMRGEKHEIIQIGAVLLDNKYRIVDEFSSYVQPEYGEVDEFIENLTGIKQEILTNAPKLRVVLMNFASWLAGRKPMVLSWSDSDYHQLQKEMRIKKIKHHVIQDLFDEWSDFQRSFDKMLGLKNQFALEDAMKISRVDFMGKMHDGLCDAYNTARLFKKVQRQSKFELEFVPIVTYTEVVKPLSFSMGELFTPDILAQIKKEETPKGAEVVEEVPQEEWSFWRKVYAFFKGKDIVTDEYWNKLRYETEMKKLDIKDWLQGFRMKTNIIQREA